MNLLYKIKNLFVGEKLEMTVCDERSYLKTWLDDECQVQFLPQENELEIKLLMDSILGKNSNNDNRFGFAQVTERGKFSHPLLDRQITPRDLEALLRKHNIERIELIERELGSKLPYEKSSEKAFRCGYDFIFDLHRGFVNQFWILPHLIVSTKDFDNIEGFIHEFATHYNLILVDWNELEIVDVQELRVLRKELMTMFK
jgi:hypothetical protein